MGVGQNAGGRRGAGGRRAQGAEAFGRCAHAALCRAEPKLHALNALETDAPAQHRAEDGAAGRGVRQEAVITAAQLSFFILRFSARAVCCCCNKK